MKKGTIALCMAAALGMSSANAFELTVNGETLEGVTITGININGTTVDVTANVDLVVYDDPEDPDDDNDGVPDVSDNCPNKGPNEDGFGCPDTDNDGVYDDVDQCPNEGPDDDGFGCPEDDDPPPPVGSCVDSDTIECAYDISTADWNSSARTLDTINIPIGKTLISSFSTGSGASIDSAKFSFRTPVGGHTEGVDLWISDQVGGTTLSSRCDLDNAQYAFQQRVTLDPSWYCQLEPNTTYYLHLRHVNPNGRSFTMFRELTTN